MDHLKQAHVLMSAIGLFDGQRCFSSFFFPPILNVPVRRDSSPSNARKHPTQNHHVKKEYKATRRTSS